MVLFDRFAKLRHCVPLLQGSRSYGKFTMKPDDIDVVVEPQYLAEQSEPDERRFLFAYTVRITNNSSQAVQVISRQWVITDGEQRVQKVGGLGVIGKQPLLNPGETFEYTSGCPLTTSVGTMRGIYHCVGENGLPFEVTIDEFMLAAPRT